jgi:hypothetical protein
MSKRPVPASSSGPRMSPRCRALSPAELSDQAIGERRSWLGRLVMKSASVSHLLGRPPNPHERAGEAPSPDQGDCGPSVGRDGHPGRRRNSRPADDGGARTARMARYRRGRYPQVSESSSGRGAVSRCSRLRMAVRPTGQASSRGSDRQREGVAVADLAGLQRLLVGDRIGRRLTLRVVRRGDRRARNTRTCRSTGGPPQGWGSCRQSPGSGDDKSLALKPRSASRVVDARRLMSTPGIRDFGTEPPLVAS